MKWYSSCAFTIVFILAKLYLWTREYVQQTFSFFVPKFLIYVFVQSAVILVVCFVFAKLTRRDLRKMLRFSGAIAVGISVCILVVYMANWKEYICVNVDTGTHFNIARFYAEIPLKDYSIPCKQDIYYDYNYWVGYINGNYETIPHKIVAKLFIAFGIPIEFSLTFISICSFLFSLLFCYLILKEVSKKMHLYYLLPFLWNFENPMFMVVNGWFTQNLMTSCILFGIYFMSHYTRKAFENGNKEYLWISIFAFIIVVLFMQFFVYNLLVLLGNPERLFHNTIDIYRFFYTINYLFTPLLYAVIQIVIIERK